MRESRLPRFLFPGLTLLLLMECVVFWGPLFRSETLAERDLAAYFRPLKSLVKPLWQISEGLPLWNPLFASGQPFAANPAHELFHPLTALFLFLPFETAFRAQFLLPPLVGGVCAYFLKRTLRRSVAAASFSGVAWGFGGYLLSAINLLPFALAASVVPAALAFAIRCGREGRSRDLAGLAVTVGLVGLAGEPSTLLMLPVLMVAAVLHERPWARPWARVRPGATTQALGLSLGLALAGAALVPGVHHASKTERAQGLPAADAGLWSMPSVRVLELLSPNVLGHVEERGSDEGWYWGGGRYPGRRSPYIYSLYPGLAVSLAAFVGAVAGWRKLWPWLSTGFFGLLLGLGVNGPLWPFIRRLPFLSGLRYPERFVLLFSLCLLVLAAHGFDWIAGRSGRARRMAVWGFVSVSGLGLIVSTLLVAGDHLPTRPWIRLGVSPQIEDRFAGVASMDALRAALVAFGGLLALMTLRKRRRLGRMALTCWTAVDLALAGRLLVPSVPVARVVVYPEVLRPLVERPPSGPLFHLAAEDQQRPLSRGLMKPPIPAQWGIPMTLERDVDLTALHWSVLGRKLFWRAVLKRPSALPALLERRGVGAILKFKPGARVVDGLFDASSSATGPLELAIPASPRPLAFAAARVVSVPDEASWVDAVLGLGDEIPVTACVGSDGARGLPTRPSPASVTVTEVRPGKVTFDVVSAGPLPSFVAVNQTWDEGWAAFVDGMPARLLRVEVDLSGLPVPPGRHRVSLVYSDPWVTGGVVISLTALLMVLFVLFGPPRPFLEEAGPARQSRTVDSS
ncbi:MAG TPA: hypothetical protein VE129_12820 [Thermoanaerobaculia bacterium]|nr:hypothetical protein [Thermoanaerobaculia bacterium]